MPGFKLRWRSAQIKTGHRPPECDHPGALMHGVQQGCQVTVAHQHLGIAAQKVPVHKFQQPSAAVTAPESHHGPNVGIGEHAMDIFGALLNGASLHTYNLRETGLTGLPDWLNGEAITVYHSVPTLLRHLFSILPAPGSLPSIRIVDL